MDEDTADAAAAHTALQTDLLASSAEHQPAKRLKVGLVGEAALQSGAPAAASAAGSLDVLHAAAAGSGGLRCSASHPEASSLAAAGAPQASGATPSGGVVVPVVKAPAPAVGGGVEPAATSTGKRKRGRPSKASLQAAAAAAAGAGTSTEVSLPAASQEAAAAMAGDWAAAEVSLPVARHAAAQPAGNGKRRPGRPSKAQLEARAAAAAAAAGNEAAADTRPPVASQAVAPPAGSGKKKRGRPSKAELLAREERARSLSCGEGVDRSAYGGAAAEVGPLHGWGCAHQSSDVLVLLCHMEPAHAAASTGAAVCSLHDTCSFFVAKVCIQVYPTAGTLQCWSLSCTKAPGHSLCDTRSTLPKVSVEACFNSMHLVVQMVPQGHLCSRTAKQGKFQVFCSTD